MSGGKSMRKLSFHVEQLLGGRTMIMVTHEMRFARDVSSQVVYLHQGRIEEQGPPEQLFNNPQSEHLQRFLSPQY